MATLMAFKIAASATVRHLTVSGKDKFYFVRRCCKGIKFRGIARTSCYWRVLLSHLYKIFIRLNRKHSFYPISMLIGVGVGVFVNFKANI